MKLLLGILGRYALVWAINVLALLLATSLLPGFRFETSDPNWWTVALVLPVEFALLLILLRPLLLLLTFPLNSLTLGLPTLLFNGIILWVAAAIEPSFIIGNILDALIGLVVLTVISTSLVGWLGIDEAYPFFQSVIYRLGQRFGPKRPAEISHGLLILQVDGLSYSSLRRSLVRGRMPMVSSLLARGSHRMFSWNCGLPSNTPAVQAGLMYGSRGEVPGYRWFDRQAGRRRVASNPADLRLLEQGAATSAASPLLAGGSCINSFMSGGAAKRLMTLSATGLPASERRKGELADFNLFWLSPWAYGKAILAAVWDFLTAVFWAYLGRFAGGRPWVRTTPLRLAQRAVANAFLRETAHFWIKQDLIRGVPVIYSNFVGYDEVAHFSGPDAYEAQISLSAFDRTLRRLRRLIRKGTPIAYDVMLLSDHGQAPSLPFARLYGSPLEAVVASLACQTAPLPETRTLDTTYLAALLAELRASRPGRPPRAAVRGQRTLERISGKHLAGVAAPPAADKPPGADLGLEVCVSGCLAHIYCQGREQPVDLHELQSLFPGLVEGLASHPGIQFVAARQEGGESVVIGSDGLRNLATGQVHGQADPLAPYGDTERWSRELARLIGYASAGDLIVNGAWLPEGKVVVFEQQSSSHGGLGGAQTEPFLVAPAAWGTRPEDLHSPESLHVHLLEVLRRLRSGPVADAPRSAQAR